jgi:tRNA threonylcarbamoyladenosine biosynthesis protein TsaB
VLVLALDTSSRRGSVALLDSGRPLADAWHEELNAHGERVLGLIDEVFAKSGRVRSELSRVAVGRGPGAFTGLRVGLALAQGIAAGLAVPIVGTGSLEAMAAALPPQWVGNRWPVIDARRGEFFVACYAEDGRELVAPLVVAHHALVDRLFELRSAVPDEPNWLLGDALRLVSEKVDSAKGFRVFHSEATDWPSAIGVGRLCSTVGATGPAAPLYLRDADAVLPNLPPCPLDQPMRKADITND